MKAMQSHCLQQCTTWACPSTCLRQQVRPQPACYTACIFMHRSGQQGLAHVYGMPAHTAPIGSRCISAQAGQYPLLQVQNLPLLPLPQRVDVHSTQLGSTKLTRAVRAAAVIPHTVGQIAEKAGSSGSLPSSNDLANLKVFFTAAPQLLAGNPAAVSSVSLVVDRTLLQPLVRLLILRLRRLKTSMILPGKAAPGLTIMQCSPSWARPNMLHWQCA